MKALPDTNVWTEFLRNPAQWGEFEAKLHHPLVFMSSVVALELLAGCRTTARRKAVLDVLKPFEKAGRVVTPDHNCFRQTGHVLASLANSGIGSAHCRQLVNDVLIAVSAAKAGLVVVTNNASDFAEIAKHTPVRWLRSKPV